MRKNTGKKIVWIVAWLFVAMNAVAFFHAYKFTHFAESTVQKTKSPDKLTSSERIETLLFGVNNPRPIDFRLPTQAYETVKLKSDETLELWHIKPMSSRGTVLLFHGYGGSKSSMLDRADEFVKLGYSVVLADFMGSGGSGGNRTTLGYKEAEEVKAVFDYVAGLGEEKIYLLGTSMGAVAVMKAINDYGLKPRGVIIECPFASMYDAVSARFRNMRVPAFPMASLLVFWGGVQNGFWAFGHAPGEYAKSMRMPVLLFYGAQDKNVTHAETEEIFRNLPGRKTLRIFESAGHESYVASRYKDDWIASVKTFLAETETPPR